MPPPSTSAPTVSFQSAVSSRRMTATISMRPRPTGRAAARHALFSSSAGVWTKVSSLANSKAGSSSSATKIRPATRATVSRKARRRGPLMATKAVMRMCSARRKATTAPSMASHRNRIEASSSDQTRGSRNT